MITARGIRYIPAIDGLRALAVMAVMLYHLGYSWIPGGFLGVDLFFVISGYVITRLILDSIAQNGGLDLRKFYKARLRRLLPPLVFMILITLIYASIWAPETVRRLVTDAPFALTGGMNWWLVARHTDYFDSISRPPLLQHTWSLGVEAQFYLIWPLVLMLILRYLGKKRIPGAALFIAAISGITLLFISFRLDTSEVSQISHIYFGTDTHSIGLFLGAALAVNWIPQNLQEVVNKRAQDFIDGIGVFGFIGMLATFLFINEADPTLYKLAFPLAGFFGCAIITSIVHPASRFAPLLSSKIMVWVGERSYSIYLWHWVVFQVTRPAVDLEGSMWALSALRVLIVFALADISLRLVELPIRSGLVEYWLRGIKYRTKQTQLRQKSLLGICSISIFSVVTILSYSAIQSSDQTMAAIKTQITQEEEKSNLDVLPPDLSGLWVTGDSVILGIRYELEKHSPISIINARVGRQVPELIAVMRHDKFKLQDSTVIFNLGNNNKLSEAQVDEVFEEVKNQPKIIVVNTAVPRDWRAENNLLIAKYAEKFGAILIDWNAISQGHPEFFAPDGVHLVPAGVRAYVGAIISKL